MHEFTSEVTTGRFPGYLWCSIRQTDPFNCVVLYRDIYSRGYLLLLLSNNLIQTQINWIQSIHCPAPAKVEQAQLPDDMQLDMGTKSGSTANYNP